MSDSASLTAAAAASRCASAILIRASAWTIWACACSTSAAASSTAFASRGTSISARTSPFLIARPDVDRLGLQVAGDHRVQVDRLERVDGRRLLDRPLECPRPGPDHLHARHAGCSRASAADSIRSPSSAHRDASARIPTPAAARPSTTPARRRHRQPRTTRSSRRETPSSTSQGSRDRYDLRQLDDIRSIGRGLVNLNSRRRFAFCPARRRPGTRHDLHTIFTNACRRNQLRNRKK